jgi:molybdate transport system ATP-binding protein
MATVAKSISKIDFQTAIVMQDVTIEYGSKKVLDRISWTVARGDRWLLSGPNGSGKSTLLSLITADNPQAYACDLTLFDRPRGSGESIWDIKKKIGYLSPELHVCFNLNCTVYDTIASGWFDTIGLYQKVSKDQHQIILDWIYNTELLIAPDKKLYKISAGQQRIVLLIRALIKNPTLLILDEPCQGMDEMTQSKMLTYIDILCRHQDTTLVYVTHYTTLRPSCITLHLELKQGRVVYNGPMQLT